MSRSKTAPGTAVRPPGAFGAGASDTEVRRATAELLRTEVAAMNVNNFVVRPKRRFVEKYASTTAWTQLDGAAYTELTHEIAGLPTELDAEDEEAKRFDCWCSIYSSRFCVTSHRWSVCVLKSKTSRVCSKIRLAFR